MHNPRDLARELAALRQELTVLRRHVGNIPTRWPVGGAGGGVETVGQYQHMAHVMVSQSEDGWDFVRAHGILGA